MKKTLLILTSLVFLAGCQSSSHNTGNITNGESSAGYSQDSGTSKELPKDRANASNDYYGDHNTTTIILIIGLAFLAYYLAGRHSYGQGL